MAMTRDLLVPVTEARDRLREILDQLDEANIILLRRSKPVAVVIDHERYARLLDRIEELEDQLSVLASQSDSSARVPLDKVKAELGLL